MILIGRYASPFTRRVAVALQVYGIGYRHESWSAFTDLEKITPFNPVGRVPILVLDSGEALVESAAILDYADQLAGSDKALIAAQGPERASTLRVCALATGLCDKLVAMIYEQRHHETVSEFWFRRCEARVEAILAALEQERVLRGAPFWFGDRLTHADVAVACAMTFVEGANPQLAGRKAWPALAEHARRCEQLAAFKATAPVFPPAAQ